MTEQQNKTFDLVVGRIRETLNTVPLLPVINNRFQITGIISAHSTQLDIEALHNFGQPGNIGNLLLSLATDVLAVLANANPITEDSGEADEHPMPGSPVQVN